MHVIIVLTDNADPIVYGPYDTEQAARLGIPSVEGILRRAGLEDRHLEQITVRAVRGPAHG